MKIRYFGLAVFAACALNFTAAHAQDDQSGYTPGEITDKVTNSAAYGDAESAAAPSPYGTTEGDSEYTGQPFDGSNGSGSYQDPDTLEPSSGIVAEPNSDDSGSDQ